MEHFDSRELKQGEIFLGNTDENLFPKPHLANLKTLRLGLNAFDIKGRLIKETNCKPMFIHKDEFDGYNSIMLNLNKDK